MQSTSQRALFTPSQLSMTVQCMHGVRLVWVNSEQASNRQFVCPNTLPFLPTLMVRLLLLSRVLLGSDTPLPLPTRVTCTHGVSIFTARLATVTPKLNGTLKKSPTTLMVNNFHSLRRWSAASLPLTHSMCKDIPTRGVRDISAMVERPWSKRQK